MRHAQSRRIKTRHDEAAVAEVERLRAAELAGGRADTWNAATRRFAEATEAFFGENDSKTYLILCELCPDGTLVDFINKYDITGVYDPSNHPDVREGKKSPEEVLSDFLDTFEIHYSAMHPGSNDDRVTFDEFKEYYNNISVNIDNDEYFQLMFTNAWKLGGGPAPR